MAKKYLDLGGLTFYDTKVKNYVDEEAQDAASTAVSTHDSNVGAHSAVLAGYVKTSREIAGKALTADITAVALTAALNAATQSLQGMMSSTDKKRLDDLWAIFDNGDSEGFVDTLTEILEIFESYPEGADLVSALASKVDANTAIQPATATKITYDSKGLVTGATSATLDDIGDGTTRKIPTIPDVSISDIGFTGNNPITTLTVDTNNKHQINVIRGADFLTSVPDITVNATGTGNTISALAVDGTDKHKLNVTFGLDALTSSDLTAITEQEIAALFDDEGN